MKKIIVLLLTILCVSCGKKAAPAEEKSDLSVLIEQSKGEIDYDSSDIEATLLTIGTYPQGFGGASASVAYILLKNDSILILAPENIRAPFSKDEARILIKSKIRGEMLIFD